MSKVRVEVQVSVVRILKGVYEAETVEEAVATAEMEARNHGELNSLSSLVLNAQKIED